MRLVRCDHCDTERHYAEPAGWLTVRAWDDDRLAQVRRDYCSTTCLIEDERADDG